VCVESVVVWQCVTVMVLYCVVEWQLVINMVCIPCGGVAAFYNFGVCTVWWCGSIS